jgi:ATP-dependent RNA helicase DDX55/SPB4
MDKYRYQSKRMEAVRIKELNDYKRKIAQREKELAEGKVDNAHNKPIQKTTAWSDKLETKERKIDRRVKKQRKREYLKKLKAGEIIPDNNQKKDTSDENSNQSKKRKDISDDEASEENDGDDDVDVDDDDVDDDEWEELQREERLAKKVKKGKMNKKEFDKQVGNRFADL